jgi:DinB superfamily
MKALIVGPQPVSDQVDERQLLTVRLRQSRDRFFDSLANVPEELCRIRPSAGAWSIIDCVEHIVIAEKAWPVRLQGRQPLNESIDRAKDEFVTRIADRNEKRSAPERAQPSGKYASLAQAAQEFLQPGTELLISPNTPLKTSANFQLSTRSEYLTFTNSCCWRRRTRNVTRSKSKRSRLAQLIVPHESRKQIHG